jgi:uncharacterized delta-60 repeat protein
MKRAQRLSGGIAQTTFLTAVVMVAWLAGTAPVSAGVGDVDVRFASHGLLEITNLRFGRVLQQPDGKLLVVGLPPPSTSGVDDTFELRRYTASGSLDSTFGVSGRQIVNLPVSGPLLGDAALQADGKVVLAGSGEVGGASLMLFVARIDATGVADATFGTGGVVNAGGTGEATDGWGFGYSGVLALPNGDLVAMVDDPGSRYVDRFDTDGRRVSRATLPGSPIAMAPTIDGRVMVLTRNTLGSVLLRLLRDGTADPSFASGGGVSLPHADAIAVAADSASITTCGSGELRRYTASGAADPTFGSESLGRVRFDDIPGLAGNRCDGLLVAANGRVVAIVSNVSASGNLTRVTSVVAVDANGRPDARVGSGNGYTALRGLTAPGTYWRGLGLRETPEGNARAIWQVSSLTVPCLCIEAIDLGADSARGAVGIAGTRVRVMEQRAVLELRVLRSGAPTGAARVRYEAVPGTAAMDDYGALSGELSWADGDGGTRVLSLPLINDDRIEGEETMLVRLFDASGVDTPFDPLNVEIVDDDALRNLSFAEGTAWRLTHDGAAAGPVTAYFYFANGIDSCCVGAVTWRAGESGARNIYPWNGASLGDQFYVSLVDEEWNEAGPNAYLKPIVASTPPDNTSGGGGVSQGGTGASGQSGGGGAFGTMSALLLLGFGLAAGRRRCRSPRVSP